MAILIADVDVLGTSEDPTRALVTLTMLTGATMLIAGLLRLGSMLRFVSNAVMVGFINAVGVNIVLGQLANLTGYAADGSNRVLRAVNTVINPSRLDGRTLLVGIATIALILLLERTPIRSLGLVVAVVGTSANFTNPDGRYPDASRDFAGQGVANLASGLLRGMPVGGSVSASALNKEAGARSRWSLVIAGGVMAVVIVAFGEVVGAVAMPALAGLLMLIGWRTIKPADLQSVWRTGPVQKSVLAVTFLLTMVIPLQYAVLVGVGLSVLLHVVRQSNQVSIRRRIRDTEGHLVEVDPPAELPAHEVVVLQPYGSLFFAAAPVFEAALPAVTASSRGSVVILRLRGRSDLGTTFMDVVRRHAEELRAVDSKLVIVLANERIIEQLQVTGITDVVGDDNVYPSDQRVGATIDRATADAAAWVQARR